jgi:hypothetical protein
MALTVSRWLSVDGRRSLQATASETQANRMQKTATFIAAATNRQGHQLAHR